MQQFIFLLGECLIWIFTNSFVRIRKKLKPFALWPHPDIHAMLQEVCTI